MKELKIKPGSVVYGFCSLHYRSDAQIEAIFNDSSRGVAPEAVKDLAAESLGGGKMKLTWTAPKGGAARYQVKWSDKQIVERLNFDIAQQTYQFDPKDHANWWAASRNRAPPGPGNR